MVKMGDVWDRTVEFLGDNLTLLLPIVLLALFVPTSIADSLAEVSASGGFGLKLGFAILSLAFAILSLWVQLAIVALAIDPAIGRRMTTVATQRLLPAVGVFLMVLVGAILLSLPIVVIAGLSGADFAAMQDGRGAQANLGGGYALALLLAGIVIVAVALFLAARLLPLSGVIVAERRGTGAIARAFALSRGIGWRLVGVVILYTVVALVAILAAQTVFGSILRLVAGGEGPISIAAIITAIVVAGVKTIFTVLAAAFCGKLYTAIVAGRDAATPISA
ncbi:hypothetical protein [Sphingomonas sp.]|uniref:hypothetical protein n=1 Tax=Sphingomonas sp. TaxID=28214 RepID=UPI002DD662C7|nr:hypothetical protein [Sphingomonas sp.]